MSRITIKGVRVIDLRFPTLIESIGSDAVNKDPDYSTAYCILATDSALGSHGLTFTLGRGTELVVRAVEHRVTEYVDPLHEHFLHPVVIRRGHYQLPQYPGYGGEIFAESLQGYAFPNGIAWKQIREKVEMPLTSR